MTGTAVAGVGLVTGWGDGVSALPADARAAAAGRRVVALPPPPLAGDRFRRATRECLLGVAAVEALLGDAGLAREDIRGSETALVYVTAGAYGAANRAFVEAGRPDKQSIAAGTARPQVIEGGLGEKRGGSGASSTDVVAGSAGTEHSVGGLREKRGGSVASSTLHFPYTAPSAVPGEVAIEFELTGAYEILIGGAAAAIDALWRATELLARGRCARALVLALETFAECEDLYARGRWLVRPPLVESAACALLIPGRLAARYAPAEAPSRLERLARARTGETLACAPLIALALARAAGEAGRVRLTGEWRGRRAGLTLEAR